MISPIVVQLAPVIKEAIDKAHRILLHCHPNPDPDSIGSSLAMYHALRGINKEVTVIAGDSEKPANLAILPGFDAIKQQTYGETDLSQFDLFIILDSGSIQMVSRLLEVDFPSNLKTITIDHHASNTSYADINLIESNYPAAAQVLYDLLTIIGVTITPDIAICLFVGIYYDTGGFRFRTVTNRTFEIAAALVEIYPKFSEIISAISDNLDPEQLYFQAAAFDHIEVFGHVATISLPYDLLQKYSFKEDTTKNQSFSNILISVRGWNLGVSIVEKEKGFNRISFRAKEKSGLDVSKIASLLGGGGHKPAAGAMVVGTNEEAKAKVIEAVYSVYPELK